jgi:hypothetical protein
VVARTARNLAIPRIAANEANPSKATPDNLKEAREIFMARGAPCYVTALMAEGKLSLGETYSAKTKLHSSTAVFGSNAISRGLETTTFPNPPNGM